MSSVHAFERAGLGLAPFRIVGVEMRRGPIVKVDPRTGIETRIGAPGQPMGCCSYCGEGIAECWQIASSDGKRFEVGCVCVKKTGDSGLASTLARKKGQLRKARETERIEAAKEALLRSDVQEALAAKPHPQEWAQAKGMTLLDWAAWMLNRAGHAGRLKAARKVEKTLQEFA